MVLESLITPSQAEHHAVISFVIGFIYASFSLFLSIWVFVDQASIVMVLLVVMAAVPLVYKMTNIEGNKTVEFKREWDLLSSHGRVVLFLLTFFVGLVLGFSFWYILLPYPLVLKVFHLQLQTLVGLNEHVTGSFAQLAMFISIFLNNLKVLLLSLFFSFLFGTGALFILSWNATVVASAIGNFIKLHTAKPGISILGYAFVSGLSFLRYFLHGIPEFLAYIVAGIAGGILSAAFIQKHLFSQPNAVLHDVMDLSILAVLFLFIAGILEVFVTPLLYTLL